MPHPVFEPYIDAAFPCYWLDADDTLTMNAAAQKADAPLADPGAVEQLLRTARQEMDQQGCRARTLPFITDALRIRTLTLLPLAGGLLAIGVEDKQAPVSAFSAEMREPLTNIFATLPLVASRLDGVDRRYAQAIQANCYSLLRLAENLESASRIQKMKFELKPVDISSLVEAICRTAEAVYLDRHITLDWSLPELPLVVRADERLLGQAILNLLRNSLQYTRDGNHIHLRLAAAGMRAVLTVQDKGLGIRPEHLEHIFEPYYSVDPYGDTPMRPGLGLGLSVVRETICGFGGSVAAESRFGEGTKISLALPVADEGDTVLASSPADYMLNQFSPVYVQLCGLCRLPEV